MTISLLQAVIIGVLGYFASIATPSGLVIGWYTLSRPLVAGMLVGLVMGDIQTGIIVGAAVQVVFIALVTPGGQVSSDLNFSSYVGIPLGVVAVKAGASVESAVAIATAVGALGTIVYNMMMFTNTIWNQGALKAAQEGNYKGIFLNHWIFPQFLQIFYRGVITALSLYFGQSFATALINTFTADSIVMRTLSVLGGLLPAVGVAILLGQTVKKKMDLVRFLFGFVLVAALGLNMVSVGIIGAFFAYSHFIYTKKDTAVIVDEDEEVL